MSGRHGRVLLIQRCDNHHWEPPGGVLEMDEAIQAGLHREVREETGLDVGPDTLIGICSRFCSRCTAELSRI